MQDKRVENVHIKFHNIQSSHFAILVELAMHGDHLNESNVCKKNKKLSFP